MVTEHRGQLSAWLQKKKHGSSVVRVRQYNRRYFTIDFDSRTFFYAHAENSKKVSSVVPFADIIDVKLPESQVIKSETASNCSQTSRTSFFRRLSTSKKLDEEEQHSFTLVTKPARTTELLCSSAAEALQWFEAFKAAMVADGGGSEGGPVPFVSGSGDESPGSDGNSPKVPSGGRAAFAPRQGDGLMAPAVAAAVTSAAAAAGASVAATGQATDDTPAEPPKKGTFLDFSTDPEETTPQLVAPAGAAASTEAEAVVTIGGPTKLQAEAFGFEAEESGSSAASSPVPSPRGANLGTPGTGSVGASSGHEIGASPPSGGSRSYEDRHKGLSMQERLASLEFSDEEDED